MKKILKQRLISGLTFPAVVLTLLLPVLTGCGSADASKSRGADEVFNEAMVEYKDKDYLEAQKLLDVIKLQYPASQYADDAQYYLAEINYAKEEFVLAAYNYNLLRRAFPTSPFAKESFYKAGLSYYALSPSFDRDQSYTKQAIQTFSEFQAFYPGDSLSVESGKRIGELRDKLAKGNYETAELYIKMSYPRSAIIYYDAVINDYPDSQYFEPAYLGKIKMLARLHRMDEAQESIRLYKQKFPNGQYLEEINQIVASLR